MSSNQLIIFCLPLPPPDQDTETYTVSEYNSIEPYQNYLSGEPDNPVENIWYGKDNIITNNIVYERRISNTMIQYSYENVHRQWPIKTSYLCYWCCHSFDTRPFFIPTKYDSVNKIFHCYGNFCSFNCALSYNNDTKTGNWTQNSELLHFLHRRIYNVNVSIKPAPPKESLNVFGGNLTIEEFRNNFTNDTLYDVIYPPIISMISQISESTKLKSISEVSGIKCKTIQKQLFKKPKKMVQRKLFS